MEVNSDDLLFSCGVDDISETDIVHSVHGINYLIDNLISNILINAHSSTPLAISRPPSSQCFDLGLLAILKDHMSTEEDAKIFLVEFLLRSLILTIIHLYFFDGRFFFGVGSGDLREKLECMLHELHQVGGRSPFLFFFFFSPI